MDSGMYDHPATQENLRTLTDRGARIVGPVSGHLASGLSGQGRMTEPSELVGHVRRLLGAKGPLSGRKLVVTAGGTQEAIDPVRIIANRSSGKQGYALAQAAIDLGADVTLISAPTALIAPVGAKLVPITSATEMLDATLQATRGTDALLMAAAVADFRVTNASQKKIKRAGGVPDLALETNPDILQAVTKASRPKVVVGFAAESDDLLKNAAQKLENKNLDLIVANDIRATDAGFEVGTNRVTLLDRSGSKDELPLMSKEDVARHVLSRVVKLVR
jgi:phosphopantothenoylcysteine decarboxylase/phosphopantothenate--cysteine ligase